MGNLLKQSRPSHIRAQRLDHHLYMSAVEFARSALSSQSNMPSVGIIGE